MTKPRVSVVMPVHNASRFVAEAVESVLTQILADFEFLIIDDGSTDDSRAIVKKFAAADPRIFLHCQAHAGIACAMNAGLARATAPYLMRMDADDVSRPMRLEKQLGFMMRRPECVAVGSFAELIDADGWPIATWRRPLTHRSIDDRHLRGFGGGIIGPSAMMRTEALRAIGGDRVEAGSAEDFDMFLRLAEVGELANIPEVLLNYRLHPGSETHVRQETHIEQTKWCLLEARRRRGLPPLPNPRLRPQSAARIEVGISLRSASALHFATAAKHLISGGAAWARSLPLRSSRQLTSVVSSKLPPARVALFISIPKNASKTVLDILKIGPNRDRENTDSPVIYENHQRGSVLMERYDLTDLWVFCFCRNPFERCVSWYQFHRHLLPYRELTFSEWIRAGLPHHWTFQNSTDFETEGLSPLLQCTFVDGCRVDFVGRIEHFERDMNVIVDELNERCNSRGIDRCFTFSKRHINRGRRCGDFESYYNRETKKRVFDLLHRDFEFFGY